MNDPSLPLSIGHAARSANNFPPSVPWSAAAIKLLKGMVYSDDSGDAWEQILAGLTPLTDYFARIGLRLVLNEEDGMAYLAQYDAAELPTDYPAIPRLFHSIPLTFEASLLCVLLREELRRFDEEIRTDACCVVSQSSLLELWQAIVPGDHDSVRANRSLSSQLRKLEELKFVRQVESEPPLWEVRRILKAKLTLSQYEELRTSLQVELQRRGEAGDSTDTGEEANE